MLNFLPTCSKDWTAFKVTFYLFLFVCVREVLILAALSSVSGLSTFFDPCVMTKLVLDLEYRGKWGG